MSGELAKVAPIAEYITRGRVGLDVAVEDFAKERARWEGGTEADQRVADAYRALESGLELIDLHQTIMRGGQARGSKLPALAVAPAHLTEVTCRASHTGEITYTAGKGIRRLWPWRFDLVGNYAWERHESIYVDATSTMPPMPPDIRAQARNEYLVLWEATWRDVHTHVQRPPMHLDPALLEHVSGGLYRVVDVWDLTPLEAAALR